MGNGEMTALPPARTVQAENVIRARNVIQSFLTPGTVSPDAFLAALVMEANDLRLNVSQEDLDDPRTLGSFMRAAMNAAVVGLVPGAALGHCYFVPYTLHRGKRSEHVVINWVPGYRGYLELAFRNNFLACCAAEVVLAGEEVRRGHKQGGPWIEHDIPVPRQKAGRENVVGTYATYTTRLGASSVVFVERPDIDAVDTKRNVWASNYVEMCKKTGVRRAAKLWQVTSSMASAIMLDEQADRGDEQEPLYDPAEQDEKPLDLGAMKSEDQE